jgi:hypothetical protein
MTFAAWCEEVKAKGESSSPITARPGLRQEGRLPEEFVMLAFQVFKDRYTNSEKGKRKTYRDWRLPSSTPSRPTGSDCGASMRMAATASPAPACRLISSIGRLRDPRPLLAHHEATRRLPLGSA